MKSGLRTLNPVLDRELRERSRTMRSIVMLTLFLATLILVLLVTYEGTESASAFNGDPFAALTLRAGRSMFEWILATELAIMLFIIPGISANAIAGERDRQTLIPLQVTLVGPLGIFLGKVLSSSGFVLLLIVAAAPIMAIPYVVGGISLTQVLLSLLSLVVLGVMLAAIGVACSAIFRRTLTATLASYGMVLLLTGGTVVALAVLSVIDSSRGVDEVEPQLAALYANPFVAVADAAGDIGSAGFGPFSPIKKLFIESQLGGDVVIQGDVVFDNQTGEMVDVEPEGGIPLWIRSLGTISMLALVLSFFGVRRLRAPQRDIRP